MDRRRYLFGALLGMALSAASSCGDDGGTPCRLTCFAQSTMQADQPAVDLTCATGAVTCNDTLDQFGRVTQRTCSWTSGHVATCRNVTYNGLGQITGGQCSSVGQSCALP